MPGLQPHRSKRFKLLNHPFFIEEVRDIVGLCLNPLDHAPVMRLDQRRQCQAVERIRFLLPVGLGYVECITHDRHPRPFMWTAGLESTLARVERPFGATGGPRR